MLRILQRALVHFAKGVTDSFEGAKNLRRIDERNDAVQRQHCDRSTRRTVLAERRALGASTKNEDSTKTVNAVNTMISCTLWNGGICGFSLVAFWMVLLPFLEYTAMLIGGQEIMELYVRPVILYAFHTFWVIPIMFIGKVVNSVWFQDMADVAWKMTRRKQRLPSLSLLMADLLFTTSVQLLFLVQGMVVSLVPFTAVALPLTLVHTSLLYAMYAFDYRWYNEGYNVNLRTSMVESRWPYYLGFGLPLAVITYCAQSYTFSVVCFSLGFPWLILSAICTNEQFLDKSEVPSLKFFAISNGLSDRFLRLCLHRALPGRQDKTVTERAGNPH